MIDKIFAPLALVLLVVFMSIIVYFVPHIDLGAIAMIGIVLAVYDFWRHAKGR